MIRAIGILTAQLAPCIFLILVGWGFDDVRGFLLSPARSGFLALTLVGAIAAILMRLDLHPLRKGSTPGGSQSLQLGILLILSLTLLWFLPFADRRGILTLQSSHWRYAGLLLFSVGVVVRLRALKSLGNCFSAYVTLQPNHRLVQEGIYSLIRHPLYLSLLLAPVGVALIFASKLATPVFILALVFSLDRIAKEERLLSAHFGSEFEDYRRQSRKLIPLIF